MAERLGLVWVSPETDFTYFCFTQGGGSWLQYS